ncbi:GLPGLI family protein [Chryseobacterium sp.]|uniref:GLPGLI family protein n=1 Tax=Chryseobacterium sp. TaxID=1871047 RepID=UPI001626073A|nr:GLPGLI family protein [Chryseobacterium sp.]
MKNFVLLFLLFGVFSSAQNQRFLYEYRFILDSTDRDSGKKEMMVLDVSPEGSKFLSIDRMKSDSVMAARLKTNPGNFDFKGIKFGQITTVVEKRYPDFSITFFDQIGMNEYQVNDDRKMTWKILPEKETIGEFSVQKATIKLFGRNWTAWFTTEIPIQDGPYKFHGLPGLILKIADDKNTHVFEIKSVSKFPGEMKWSFEADKAHVQPLIKVNAAAYKKLFMVNRENPSQEIRQIMTSGRKVTMTDETGKVLDIEKVLRDRDRNQKAENQKNNNILELDLLK